MDPKVWTTTSPIIWSCTEWSVGVMRNSLEAYVREGLLQSIRRELPPDSCADFAQHFLIVFFATVHSKSPRSASRNPLLFLCRNTNLRERSYGRALERFGMSMNNSGQSGMLRFLPRDCTSIKLIMWEPVGRNYLQYLPGNSELELVWWNLLHTWSQIWYYWLVHCFISAILQFRLLKAACVVQNLPK